MLGRDAHASLPIHGRHRRDDDCGRVRDAAVVRRLAADGTRSWARNGAAAAMLAGLWIAIISTDLPWVIVAPAVTIAVCVALRTRRMDFGRHDSDPPPCLRSDLPRADRHESDRRRSRCNRRRGDRAGDSHRAAIRPRRSTGLAPALCFSLAPLALTTQTMLFARDQRDRRWPAMIIAIVTPFFFACSRSATHRRRGDACAPPIAFDVYPLAALATQRHEHLGAEGKPRIDLSRTGQHVLPRRRCCAVNGRTATLPPHGSSRTASSTILILQTRPLTLGHVSSRAACLGRRNAIAQVRVCASGRHGSP